MPILEGIARKVRDKEARDISTATFPHTRLSCRRPHPRGWWFSSEDASREGLARPAAALPRDPHGTRPGGRRCCLRRRCLRRHPLPRCHSHFLFGPVVPRTRHRRRPGRPVVCPVKGRNAEDGCHPPGRRVCRVCRRGAAAIRGSSIVTVGRSVVGDDRHRRSSRQAHPVGVCGGGHPPGGRLLAGGRRRWCMEGRPSRRIAGHDGAAVAVAPVAGTPSPPQPAVPVHDGRHDR